MTRLQKIEKGKIYQIFSRKEPDTILFEGSKAACLRHFKSNSLSKKDYGIGKLIIELN